MPNINLSIEQGCAERGYAQNWRYVQKYDANMPDYSQHAVEMPGLRIQFLVANDDPNGDTKVRIATQAVANLNKGYVMPRHIRIYCHNSTQGMKLPSLGYAYKRDQNDSVRFAIFLGPHMTTFRPVKSDDPDTTTIARGGFTPTGGPRLVADQVRDYYGTRLDSKGIERMVLANIYHELGHAFHQLESMDHYFSLAEQHAEIYIRGSTSHGPHRIEHEKVLAIGKYGVSAWSSQASSVGGIPEFVAEVFSALMMGMPLHRGVIKAYRACGGPMPPESVRHERRGQRPWPYADLPELVASVPTSQRDLEFYGFGVHREVTYIPFRFDDDPSYSFAQKDEPYAYNEIAHAVHEAGSDPGFYDNRFRPTDFRDPLQPIIWSNHLVDWGTQVTSGHVNKFVGQVIPNPAGMRHTRGRELAHLRPNDKLIILGHCNQNSHLIGWKKGFRKAYAQTNRGRRMVETGDAYMLTVDGLVDLLVWEGLPRTIRRVELRGCYTGLVEMGGIAMPYSSFAREVAMRLGNVGFSQVIVAGYMHETHRGDDVTGPLYAGGHLPGGQQENLDIAAYRVWFDTSGKAHPTSTKSSYLWSSNYSTGLLQALRHLTDDRLPVDRPIERAQAPVPRGRNRAKAQTHRGASSRALVPTEDATPLVDYLPLPRRRSIDNM